MHDKILVKRVFKANYIGWNKKGRLKITWKKEVWVEQKTVEESLENNIGTLNSLTILHQKDYKIQI